jgi:VanZ family protein
MLIPIPKKMQNKTGRWDKLIHFSVYGILGFFAQSALSMFALVYTVILAALTELLQKFIPTRSPDIVDFSTNIMGIIVGTSLWELVRKRG